MRRHPPHLIQVSKEDKMELERLVRDGRTEQRVARRARVLLAMEREQTVVEELAERVEMSCSGIWYVCRRYEEKGAVRLSDPLGRVGNTLSSTWSPLGRNTIACLLILSRGLGRGAICEIW